MCHLAPERWSCSQEATYKLYRAFLEFSFLSETLMGCSVTQPSNYGRNKTQTIKLRTTTGCLSVWDSATGSMNIFYSPQTICYKLHNVDYESLLFSYLGNNVQSRIFSLHGALKHGEKHAWGTILTAPILFILPVKIATITVIVDIL